MSNERLKWMGYTMYENRWPKKKKHLSGKILGGGKENTTNTL